MKTLLALAVASLCCAPAAAGPVEIEAKIAPGSKSSDPRKGAVDLVFKYNGKDVKVAFNFDKVKEPKGGDGATLTTLNGPNKVRLFTGSNETKTVTKDIETWKYGALVEYDPPNNGNPLGTVTDEEDTTGWEFGLIQNSEKLDYKFDYGDGTSFGGAVPAKALDVSPGTPGAAPFYHDDAHVGLVFGKNPINIGDMPQFMAPPSKGAKDLSSASLDGSFTLWFVLREKKSGDLVYLWNIGYELSRKWTVSAGLMAGAGGTASVSGGSGKGSSAPVMTGTTTHKQLKASWKEPPPVKI